MGPLELWDDGPGLNLRGLLDPAAIFLFIKRNLILIAAVAGVVTVLCTLALWLLFDQYVATALVLVDPRDAKTTATPDVLANIGPDSIAVESLVQVAKSDAFLGALVDQQGLGKDAEFSRASRTRRRSEQPRLSDCGAGWRSVGAARPMSST